MRIDAGLVIAVIAIVFVLIVLRTMVHIVPEFQRLVVLFLGKFQMVAGPGLIVIFPPPIQQAFTVDLREEFDEIPQQTCITKDNAPINIDFLIYRRVVDPGPSVLQARNFASMVRGIATTTLRAVIGDIALDDVLAKRERINEVLRVKLDEVTQRWGVKVTTVEIREIIPPREIQDAMNRQMSAERNKRAAILEAEGKKQATITVAEGDKQSAILRAEGQRQAAILNAEGFALALARIFETAQTVDAKTMTLQYLEALKSLGASPATKFVIPTEFTSLAAPLLGFAQRGASGDRG